MKVRAIPVQVSIVKTSDGQKKSVPTIPLRQLVLGTTSEPLQNELQDFAQDYDGFIQSCREVITVIEGGKKLLRKVNPQLFWVLGDRILGYTTRNGERLFYLDGVYQHLSRDLRYSKSSLKKILAFRKRFSELRQVDPGKSWDHYRRLF